MTQRGQGTAQPRGLFSKVTGDRRQTVVAYILVVVISESKYSSLIF